MSSHIKISSPFIKKYSHENYTASGNYTEFVPQADAYKRRVSVIIQNQGTGPVFFNCNGAAPGIIIAAGFTLSFDNYNGSIWLKSTSGSETVHVAIAEA